MMQLSLVSLFLVVPTFSRAAWRIQRHLFTPVYHISSFFSGNLACFKGKKVRRRFILAPAGLVGADLPESGTRVITFGGSTFGCGFPSTIGGKMKPREQATSLSSLAWDLKNLCWAP